MKEDAWSVYNSLLVIKVGLGDRERVDRNECVSVVFVPLNEK